MSADPAAIQTPRGRRAGTAPFSRAAQIALIGALLYLAWEGAVRLFDIPAFILPTPTAVLERVVRDLLDGSILPHFWITLIEVLAGFALATVLGVGLGTLVALVPILDRTVYPFILAFQTIPKVAVAPLLLIWFGFGMQSKIVTAALIAFFPILVNVIVGLRTGDPRRLLLMRALRAGPVQTYLKVRLPNMMPYLFAGLEVGAIFSVIGAIVGEFIGASQGLGSVIIQRQAAVDVAGVFSVLFYLALMGTVLSLALKLIARRFAFWSVPRDLVSA